MRGAFGGEPSKPIGHYKTLKAPFIAQDVLQELAIFCTVHTVHSVVRRHDAECPTFAHCNFKGK